MNRLLTSALTLTLLLVLRAEAQPDISKPSKTVPKEPSVADIKTPLPAGSTRIRYRCLSWETKCFTNIREANALVRKLVTSGFQVEESITRDRLYCVRYRVTHWQAKAFDGPAGAAQARLLRNWLRGLDCEVVLEDR